MTDLNKGVIEASNDNQTIKLQQVEGSDVVSTEDSSQETATSKNIQSTSFEISEKPSDIPQKPSNDNQKISSVKIDGMTYTQTQIDTAISTYGLDDMLQTVNPVVYKKGKSKNILVSINQLLNELKLASALKKIKKRPGAHPGKGLPSKRALVEYLYGLNRYETERIEALDGIWVRKAIKSALKNNIMATSLLVKHLKEENQKKYKEFKLNQVKEAKKQAFSNKIAKAQQADEKQPFDGAIVDLTQMPQTYNLSSMTLPLADDALVLIAVLPEHLPEAFALINTLGLTYVDNVVWNRDRIKGQYKWSKNCHTNILIATKGQLEDPVVYMRLESIHFDHQYQSQTNLPDYYFSVMENLIPGGTFLEKFSCRQFSNQWFSI